MNRSFTIFWLAGESSGDLHASKVMQRMNADFPNLRHVGIGGKLMQEQGLKPLFPFDRFAIMGFVEVLRHLGFFIKVQNKIRKYIQIDKPDLAILVDYPGLNLRVARILDDERIPVLYYICPQFWAWKRKRVYDLKDNVRHVAVILPFEKELLDIYNVSATYVGHPIAEEIKLELDREAFARFFGLDPEKQWIGFLPGSRNAEISKLLPIFLEAAALLDPDKYQFLFSKARSVNHHSYMQIMDSAPRLKKYIIDGYNYELMKYSELLISCSGTATLEAAFIGTPSIVCYKASPLSYWIGRYFVRIKRIGLPNIVLEEDVLPELVQENLTAKTIAANAFRILSDPDYAAELRVKLFKLRGLLEGKKTSVEMLKIIRKLLKIDA
ncbi:MAG TPA: lipid-A-disaccharide synthase [Candidatus Cloacimonadota bacterium]|nr:lipid-A-disaccharide synthase [Candidatus Cloacimonadota bacterium]